jgi:hypothetical protein
MNKRMANRALNPEAANLHFMMRQKLVSAKTCFRVRRFDGWISADFEHLSVFQRRVGAHLAGLSDNKNQC